ncbi:MAG: DUF1579 family protein [Planctomycetota bacterium]
MNRKAGAATGVIVAGSVLTAWAVQPAKKADTNPGEAYATAFMGGMGGAGMEAWQDSLTPGLGHDVIRQFEGDWSVRMTSYPGQPNESPMGSYESENRMGFNGLYLEMRGEGEMFGKPAESLLVMGHDKLRGLFTLTMFDAVSPSPRLLKGNMSIDGTTISFVGEMDEPLTGEVGKYFMAKWSMDGPDRYVYRHYEILYGDPFLVVEAVATRK